MEKTKMILFIGIVAGILIGGGTTFYLASTGTFFTWCYRLNEDTGQKEDCHYTLRWFCNPPWEQGPCN